MIYLCTFDKANTVGHIHHFYDVSDKIFYVVSAHEANVSYSKLTLEGHVLSANKIKYQIPETLNIIPVYIGMKRMCYLNNLLEKIIFEKL